MDGISTNPRIDFGPTSPGWHHVKMTIDPAWYPDMTDEERMRMVTCAQNPSPLITPEIRRAMLGGPLPPRPAPLLSEVGIERIVERTAQRVLDLLREARTTNLGDGTEP